jgi:hypothetical protein
LQLVPQLERFKMKFTSAAILLVCSNAFVSITYATPNPAAEHHEHPYGCLTDEDALLILKHWTGVYSGNLALVDKTVASNIIGYDQGFTYGQANAELYNGKAAFIKNVKNGLDGVKNVHFDTIFTFHDCSNIAFRWRNNFDTDPSTP